MFRSRTMQASLIGCLAALASFCALNARGADNYSIVAQSSRSSAATGRRPLAERIAAANLPIIVQGAQASPVARNSEQPAQENVAVAAVPVDALVDSAAEATSSKPQDVMSRVQDTAKAFWRTATGSRSTVTR